MEKGERVEGEKFEQMRDSYQLTCLGGAAGMPEHINHSNAYPSGEVLEAREDRMGRRTWRVIGV